MEISDRIENVGGGSAYAGYGGIGLFLIAIFLVILFAAFRQHGYGNGYGAPAGLNVGQIMPNEGCADKLTWARFANYEDPQIARNHEEIIRQAGDFRVQQAKDTGELKCTMQQQTHELTLGQERNTWAILTNQNQIARDQERAFYTARMEDANRREAEARERNLVLENRLTSEQASHDADRRHWELLAAQNAQFCLVNNRITQIEGSMLKGAPCYVPTAPVATFTCGPKACGCSA